MDESSGTIVLTLTVQGFSIPVTAAYTFADEDNVSLTIAAAIATILGPQLFDTEFNGDLRITAERI